LQLLLEDITDLENKQKGKQVAGKQTYLDIALMHMKEEVLSIQQFIEDRILALSTSSAIATD